MYSFRYLARDFIVEGAVFDSQTPASCPLQTIFQPVKDDGDEANCPKSGTTKIATTRVIDYAERINEFRRLHHSKPVNRNDVMEAVAQASAGSGPRRVRVWNQHLSQAPNLCMRPFCVRLCICVPVYRPAHVCLRQATRIRQTLSNTARRTQPTSFV